MKYLIVYTYILSANSSQFRSQQKILVLIYIGATDYVEILHACIASYIQSLVIYLPIYICMLMYVCT